MTSSKKQATENNSETLKALEQVMRQQETKNPKLAAKQARLLKKLKDGTFSAPQND
ncbi:hypothetical protein [uncultured Thiohalocapsa sp.]|uniref:hypothetical protein n=1 Tax=uncultured Thiohalocapsa sp. TaxID=768990 RepID=UPI0025D7B04C|nr:hypothetical protein [uncultured Thiohalocapsa sp.]